MLTFFFFSTSPPPLDIYTLSLHDALPILRAWPAESDDASVPTRVRRWTRRHDGGLEGVRRGLSGGHDAGADARQCALLLLVCTPGRDPRRTVAARREHRRCDAQSVPTTAALLSRRRLSVQPRSRHDRAVPLRWRVALPSLLPLRSP